MEDAGKDVEALLGGDPPISKEAWRRMKGWYRAAVNRGLPPARATIERITAERVELYSQVPSPGDNIPVTVNPSKIDDSVPTEDEIAEVVQKLRSNRSGGPLRIRAEHLKGWLAAAKIGGLAEEKGKENTEAEEEGGELMGKVVEITQTAFSEGNLVEEATWQTVVLIPKGKGEFRGIGLVEVTWKVVAVILNRRLTAGLKFHDALHRLREGRGTGMATLYSKLLQHLAAMREEVLYVIFLDLTKAYDALDRSRSLEILKGYRVGDRVRRLLREYWDNTTMVERAGGYYGKGFKGGRGMTQGEPMSPTILNVVVDAVVRHWVTIAVTEAETRRERGREVRHRPPYSMRMTSCLRRPTPSGCSGRSHSSLGCLTGWNLTQTPGKR